MTDIYEDSWKTYGKEAADLIEKYTPKLRSICHRWSNGNTQVFDDLWSELCWKIPRFIELWDPTKGVELTTYIFGVCNWHCSKYHAKNRQHNERYETMDGDQGGQAESKIEQQLDVKILLAKLPDDDRWLLECHFLDGLTVEEIAKHLNKHVKATQAQVAERIDLAVDNAKQVAGKRFSSLSNWINAK